MSAPSRNPSSRSISPIMSDAGMVVMAVPSATVEIGRVASDFSGASVRPASPPTVMIRTEAV